MPTHLPSLLFLWHEFHAQRPRQVPCCVVYGAWVAHRHGSKQIWSPPSPEIVSGDHPKQQVFSMVLLNCLLGPLISHLSSSNLFQGLFQGPDSAGLAVAKGDACCTANAMRLFGMLRNGWELPVLLKIKETTKKREGRTGDPSRDRSCVPSRVMSN